MIHGVAEGRTRGSNFTFTFHFHALEKEMTTHSSVLAWRIPGTGAPGGLPSVGSHRVGHDWSDLAAAGAGGRSELRVTANGCGRWWWKPSEINSGDDCIIPWLSWNPQMCTLQNGAFMLWELCLNKMKLMDLTLISRQKFQVILIKTVWYWQKDRDVSEYRNRVQETD